MFELTQNIKYLRTQREQVVAIIESINQPMVAAGGHALESTKAYIVGLRCQSGYFSIYVYLHLLDSNDCLIYMHNPPEIPLEEYHEMELEALGFVESMGFMIDNLNFRNLDVSQQEALMSYLPVFKDNLISFAKTEVKRVKTEEVDTSDDEDEILELEEVAEVVEVAQDAQNAARMANQEISEEGLAKIIRLLSSF